MSLVAASEATDRLLFPIVKNIKKLVEDIFNYTFVKTLGGLCKKKEVPVIVTLGKISPGRVVGQCKYTTSIITGTRF